MSYDEDEIESGFKIDADDDGPLEIPDDEEKPLGLDDDREEDPEDRFH